MAASPAQLVAVLDANVLYPQFLRDVLLRLAAAELCMPRWSDRIQGEWMRNLAEDRPDIPPARIARVRTLMEEASPEAGVKGYRAYEKLFAGVDPKGLTHEEGISREDLMRALREHGVEDPEVVRSAILEVDGAISVLREDEVPPVTKPHHRIRGLKRRG